MAVRGTDHLAGRDGDNEYNNRLVAFLELGWGRLVSWEDYEDTERIADWDRRPFVGRLVGRCAVLRAAPLAPA